MKGILKPVGTGLVLAQMVFTMATFNASFASDFYVDPVNGNNAWTGSSPAPVAPTGPKKNIYDGPGGDFSALEIPGLTAGDTIRLLPGTYNTASGEVFPYDFGDYQNLGGPVLPDGVRIRGEGDATPIEGDSSLGAFLFGSAAGGGTWTNLTRLENLSVSNPAGAAIAFKPQAGDTLSPTIDGCTLKDSDRGIHSAFLATSPMSATVSPVVNASTIRDNANEGIALIKFLNTAIGLDMHESTVEGNGADGVHLSIYGGTPLQATITGSTLRDNGGDGLFCYCYAVSHVIAVSDCTISENDRNGVRMTPTLGTLSPTIDGCTIEDNDDHGIHLFPIYSGAFTSAAVSCNTIRGHNDDGIFLEAVLGGSVSGTIAANTVTENGGDGVGCFAMYGGAVTATLGMNTLRFNDGNGLELWAATGGTLGPVIEQNDVQANGENGALLYDAAGAGTCNPDFGLGAGGSAGFNYFSDNHGEDTGGPTQYYEVYCLAMATTTPQVSAENNYWGVTRTGDIDAVIYDGGDHAGLSPVNYAPHLNAYAGVVPVSGWSKTYVVAAGADAFLTTWSGFLFDASGKLAALSVDPLPSDGVLTTWDIWGGTPGIDGNIYNIARPLGDWNLTLNAATLFAGMWRSGGGVAPSGWGWHIPTGFRARGTEFVIPMSGWRSAKIYVCAAKWPGVTAGTVEVYDAGGTLAGTVPFTLDRFGAVWQSGDLYAYAKPAVVRLTADRDVTVGTGQYDSVSGGSWGSEVYPLTRAKGQGFLFPANGWSRCWFEMANVTSPPLAVTGTVTVYDATGTQQGTAIDFDIPDKYGYFRTDPAAIYSRAKPAVVSITTDADVVVRHARYTTSGGLAGWGYSVLPAPFQEGGDFEFPMQGWANAYAEIANTSGIDITATVTVYDKNGTPVAGPVVSPSIPYLGYLRTWDLLAGNLYDYARPAKLTITTSGNAVVTSNMWTSASGGKAGWACGVLPY